MPKKIKKQTREGLLTKREFDEVISKLYERITTYSRSNNELILDIIGEVFARKDICDDSEYLDIVNKKNEALRTYRSILKSGETNMVQKLKDALQQQGIPENYLTSEFKILESMWKEKQVTPTVKLSDVKPTVEKEEPKE